MAVWLYCPDLLTTKIILINLRHPGMLSCVLGFWVFRWQEDWDGIISATFGSCIDPAALMISIAFHFLVLQFHIWHQSWHHTFLEVNVIPRSPWRHSSVEQNYDCHFSTLEHLVLSWLNEFRKVIKVMHQMNQFDHVSWESPLHIFWKRMMWSAWLCGTSSHRRSDRRSSSITERNNCDFYANSNGCFTRRHA